MRWFTQKRTLLGEDLNGSGNDPKFALMADACLDFGFITTSLRVLAVVVTFSVKISASVTTGAGGGGLVSGWD